MRLLKSQWIIGATTLQHIREVSLRAKVKKIDPWQLYEPPIKNQKIYPEYPLLSLQLDSMDFVPLEKFHSYAHRKARQFKFKVIDRYMMFSSCDTIKHQLPTRIYYFIPLMSYFNLFPAEFVIILHQIDKNLNRDFNFRKILVFLCPIFSLNSIIDSYLLFKFKI